MRLLLCFLVLAIAVSCRKTTVVPPEEIPPINGVPASNASLKLNISHVGNGNPLVLNPASTYTTTNSDTFSVKLFKYYLTNVKLTNHAGEVVAVPGSYFLVDESDPLSKVITLQHIPAGDYKAISFMIGVDSARNVSGAQTCALDPSHGMFWTWNSGYIMAKLEGSSRQSGNSLGDLSFHIGGFSGANKGIRTVTLPFPIDAHVHAEHQSQVNMTGEITKWFSGINTIDFAFTFDVTTISSRSRSIADNYVEMFTVTSVVN